MEVEERELNLIRDLERLPYFRNFFRSHFFIGVRSSLRPRIRGEEISFPKYYIIVPKNKSLIGKIRYYFSDLKEWLKRR